MWIKSPKQYKNTNYNWQDYSERIPWKFECQCIRCDIFLLDIFKFQFNFIYFGVGGDLNLTFKSTTPPHIGNCSVIIYAIKNS